MAHVLVCGTNYGRMYLQAIESAGGAYTLAGILAQGSARSQEVAERYRVPLYRTVEEVPEGVDLAGAAMGPSGSATVLELLRRRIHVLCEHPQKADYLETALATAAAHRVCFHLNGHFAALDASRAFIERAAELRRSGQPAFLDAMVTDRSLYGALDILKAALDTFEPFEFELTSSLPPFVVVQGALGGVQATFQVQCSDGEWSEASGNYLVEYRIALGFPTGILTLVAPGGPMVWNSSLYRTPPTNVPLWQLADSARPVSFSELHQKRVHANLRSMNALLANAREGTVPNTQRPEYILEISRVWEAIGRKLGR